ncbi:hypothetical protein DLAC_05546 [Tieghemostelium lacteum]|uniref:Uncharacterized protein n=1 Tax=Tieghemostelium lacteum TaxID=361077 RepID=A0A151ZG95_TIELA|nr:hypothetical protein DLAC_05546 [Tieghemostelium lacteum]|eukprot:KYQ92947.1 hypothetical protein DLAC_05546 [Tieghemostelium lacteum]
MITCRDLSDKYFQFREVAKQEKKKRDQQEFLTFVQNRPITKSPNNENNSSFSKFPNIFINKTPVSTPPPPPTTTTTPVNGNLTNLPHCSSCGKEFGLFTSKIACDLCYINFCEKCVKKITSKDITGVLREGQVKQYCSKCVFIVTREESKRRFEFSCKASLSDPLLVLFQKITDIKDLIQSRIPNFEYLGSTITDFNKVNAKNKEAFILVYGEVVKFQNELQQLFMEFDKHFKLIQAVPVVKGSSQEKVHGNMKHVYVTFLQQHLPKFNNLKEQIQHLELNTITNIYIILCRVSMDNQLHREFWSKYQVEFQTAIKSIRTELFNSTLKCGENWDKHKSFIDEMICATEKSHLNIDGHPSKEFEGTLLRKNKEIIQKIQEQVHMRTKPDELPQSKQSLQQLAGYLNSSYQSSMIFK